MSVHLFDLRGKTPEQALRAVLNELGEGTPLTGTDRALLLDETRLLTEHTAAVEAVFDSRRVRSVVCVAVGPPTVDDGRRGLDRPGQLRGVAVLWVGDTTGVRWGLRPPAPPRAHPGVAPGAGLEHLLSALGQVEVFDRVVELSGQLPDAAASPGLAWAAPDGDGTVASALAAALRGFTSAGGSAEASPQPPSGAASTGTILADLVSGTHRARPGEDRTGRGESAEYENRARDAVATAEETLATMSGAGGAVASLPPEQIRREDLRQVGEALEAYRGHVELLFSRLDPLTGPRLSAELDRAGIDGRAPTPEEADEALNALIRRVEDGLHGGVPAAGVVEDLDRVSERVSPRGSAALLPRVRRVAPDELVGSLSDPPPFPAPAPGSPLLVAALLLPALPALAGGWLGLVGGITTALAWVLALALGFRRARGPGSGLPTLVTHAVTAFAGVFAGLGVSSLLRLDLLISPPVALALALPACAVAGGAVLLYTWTRLARRWRDEVGLDRAGTAVSALTALVDEAAREEWYPRDGRRRLADAARSAANAVRAVSDALAESAAALPPPAAHPPELEAVLRSDLSALARTALGDLWSGLRSGTPVDDAYDRINASAADLMVSYGDHLTRVGPHTPPGFADPGAPRQIHDSPDLDQALHTLRLPPEEPMLQLCDPVHLSLLSESAPAVRAVRFAPGPLRARVESGGQGPVPPAESAVWAHGESLTGVLRLVPLRLGRVRERFGTEPPNGRDESEGHDGHGARDVSDGPAEAHEPAPAPAPEPAPDPTADVNGHGPREAHDEDTAAPPAEEDYLR